MDAQPRYFVMSFFVLVIIRFLAMSSSQVSGLLRRNTPCHCVRRDPVSTATERKFELEVTYKQFRKIRAGILSIIVLNRQVRRWAMPACSSRDQFELRQSQSTDKRNFNEVLPKNMTSRLLLRELTQHLRVLEAVSRRPGKTEQRSSHFPKRSHSPVSPSSPFAVSSPPVCITMKLSHLLAVLPGLADPVFGGREGSFEVRGTSACRAFCQTRSD